MPYVVRGFGRMGVGPERGRDLHRSLMCRESEKEFTMSLAQRVQLRVRRHRVLSGIASDVAERSFAAIWERIQGKARVLPWNESRGYVRAHAAAEVRRALDVTVRRHHLPEMWHDRLVELAVELLVERIEGRLKCAEPASAILRRAA
jgi:hypothetical protein